MSARMYVCHIHACKKALDFLKLKFQMVVSNHVAAGNPTWVLSKSIKFS